MIKRYRKRDGVLLTCCCSTVFLSFYVGNVVMNRTCNVVDNGDLDAEDRMVDKKDEEKKMSMAADNEM